MKKIERYALINQYDELTFDHYPEWFSGGIQSRSIWWTRVCSFITFDHMTDYKNSFYQNRIA